MERAPETLGSLTASSSHTRSSTDSARHLKFGSEPETQSWESERRQTAIKVFEFCVLEEKRSVEKRRGFVLSEVPTSSQILLNTKML